MELKGGVTLDGLGREIRYAFNAMDRVHLDQAGTEATVTSTVEGEHSAVRSAHYRGDAVDLRIWHVEPDVFAAALTEALGEDYVVIEERDHVHVHWSPIFHAG